MAAYPFRPCPMSNPLTAHYAATLDEIRAQGLFKSERIITGPQSAEITLEDGRTVLNFCANNYLGLADHPDIINAAKDALDTHGFGMASVRFICGTQDLHKQLEKTIADFFGTEDTILYAACFDANGGLFEPLLGEDDAIISDALNHASIIDGVRLCKAQRFRYANCDMADLEKQLQAAEAAGCRTRLITTDGVFSMDGFIAPLDEITALAKKYGALVHIDECHATGFLGATGRGSAEVKGVMDRIDIFTGTLGKAMGGALGGFTTARKEVIEQLQSNRSQMVHLFDSLVRTIPDGVASTAYFLISEALTLMATASPSKPRREFVIGTSSMISGAEPLAAGASEQPTLSCCRRLPGGCPFRL